MSMSWPRKAVLAAFVFSVSSCASAHAFAGEPTRASRNVLKETELASLERLNALQALKRLRPQWLSTRGQSVLLAPSREAVRVYLDGMLLGNTPSLGRIPVRTVGEIRHLSAAQATLRFGGGHASGAILVTTRHGKAPGREDGS